MPTNDVFRTATGQTGRDAYIYEAAAIANAQRELDARAARLADTIATENPDGIPVVVSIASERYPDAKMDGDLLPMLTGGFFRIGRDARSLIDYLRSTPERPARS